MTLGMNWRLETKYYIDTDLEGDPEVLVIKITNEKGESWETKWVGECPSACFRNLWDAIARHVDKVDPPEGMW